jgi:hypothetical protein
MTQSGLLVGFARPRLRRRPALPRLDRQITALVPTIDPSLPSVLRPTPPQSRCEIPFRTHLPGFAIARTRH